MVQAIRRHVVVKPGGIVEVQDPELPEGADAEVIVLLKTRAERDLPPLSKLVGSAKGVFGSADEIDAYIRELHDEWD